MRFAEIEAEFRRLKVQYDTGTLSEADFKARLQDLMLQDEQGRWWMIGYETGQWYVHDGEKWVRSEPPISPKETAVGTRTPERPIAAPVKREAAVSRPGAPPARRWLWAGGGVVGVILVAIMIAQFARQCQATPTPAPVPPATAARTPAATQPAVPTGRRYHVGVVTDVGGVNDKSFNQSAWAGAEKAMEDLGIDAKFIESKQPTDYEKNIDQFATEKYDAIITVGFLMGDATAARAKQYPNIKFAIIDNAYFPTKDYALCPDTVKDCYVDGGLTNVTSLMFQEDQAGCLAGVLAAGMTKTGTICSVSGMEIPPVVRFVTGYQNCAKTTKPDVKTLKVYIPSFTDPARGKEVGQSMIDQGCDVIFGVGGNTGNGGLLAAKEKGLMAIGVDVDQYNTYPEVKDALISSAAKNVDVAVYNFLKSLADGTVKAGISTANISNGGVGLAPYHDWESKIPQSVKDLVAKAAADLKSGALKTGY